MPTDKTEQVTLGIKQSLSFLNLVFFFKNSNNKYNFVAIKELLWHIAVALQFKQHANQSLPIYKLWHEINMNEHQNVSCFNQGKMSKHTFLKLKSTNVNLISCLVCLFVCWTKIADSALWLVRSSVNQTPCEGSIAWFTTEHSTHKMCMMCIRLLWPLVLCKLSLHMHPTSCFTLKKKTATANYILQQACPENL